MTRRRKRPSLSCRKSIPASRCRLGSGVHWSDDPTFNMQYQRIVEGLRKAGVPEGEKKTN